MAWGIVVTVAPSTNGPGPHRALLTVKSVNGVTGERATRQPAFSIEQEML